MKRMIGVRQISALLQLWLCVMSIGVGLSKDQLVVGESLVNATRLRMFVDELPDMPKVFGYEFVDGKPVPKLLKIGMFHKKWKFHNDLPASEVFAYGTSKLTASVPGPSIEALVDIDTYITWENHLPSKHILPWDPTIPTGISANQTGVPTVVHLHGTITEPKSDGHATSWYTTGFKQRGPTWANETYHYYNKQQPGNLWYHDHAMGLTRENILAGMLGAYVIRQPEVETPLGLPHGDEFDLNLLIFDRDFYTNGSIYMSPTGNNPTIHPQWQPEYFGDVIVVNGKAWPYMNVKRRKYRFRIRNASNARFFRLYFINGLKFTHVGSDSTYLKRPITTNETFIAPSESADVIVDFAKSKSNMAILANDAPYPYPTGDTVNEANSKVMKFIIDRKHVNDNSKVPSRLLDYPRPKSSDATRSRYIALYEYTSDIDEPTHLLINALSFDDPVTETPKVGTSEVWYVINLTEDNHPLHIHFGLFSVLRQVEIIGLEKFKKCMNKLNDVKRCNIHKHARGKTIKVVGPERGWKNVYKMMPGFFTKILVRFSYIHSNSSYPFDATAEPGFAYHCHILDHEDNVMMRPLKLVNH